MDGLEVDDWIALDPYAKYGDQTHLKRVLRFGDIVINSFPDTCKGLHFTVRPGEVDSKLPPHLTIDIACGNDPDTISEVNEYLLIFLPTMANEVHVGYQVEHESDDTKRVYLFYGVNE